VWTQWRNGAAVGTRRMSLRLRAPSKVAAAGQGEAAAKASQGGDAARPMRRAAARLGRVTGRLLALLLCAPMVAVVVRAAADVAS